MQALVPVNEVISSLLDAAVCVTQTEQVSIDVALGRVVAQDHVSAIDVPPEDNSAMDGYALNVDPGHGITVGEPIDVSQRIAAGHVGQPLQAGSLARIFTGAQIPPGANAVIMQEEVELRDSKVVLTRLPQPGANIRPRAQDIKQGEVIIPVGTKLGATELGLLASIGCDTVTVYRKLKIALLSTGDELVHPGKPLAQGQIYNSNLFLLKALIEKMGMESEALDIVADDLESTREALLYAAENSDCIVSTGGVSVGEEDYVKSAVEQLGNLSIWRIKMKPGKPLAFGDVSGTPFFGLPGNPVSTFVTFCILARPYLLKYQGCNSVLPRLYQFKADFDYQGGTRREYIRVRLQDDSQQGVVVEKYPQQGSGILTSTSWATALAIVEPESSIEKGQYISVLLKDELVGS